MGRMLAEPLAIMILLLFLAFIALVLLVWFSLNFWALRSASAPEIPETQLQQETRRKVVQSTSSTAQTAKLPEVIHASEEAKRRLSNDQVRGLRARVTHREPASVPATLSSQSAPKEDPFERFIKNKGDELEF
ncbi:MAG: hypothetical protein GFH24_608434n27 [Chloroflexi bacterium AL-N5]|nr:hypothetical protein [Chloroflexi bacterium AL-N5]